jgi:hypothetical protein
MQHLTSISKKQSPVKAESLLAKEHMIANVSDAFGIGVIATNIVGALVTIWQETLDALNNADNHGDHF